METTENNSGFKAKIQKLGSYLSDMVMPNIGAFIAWGIITALFIPTGYFPNEQLNTMVGPMQTFLLPLLIAYSGGNMVHGQRGAVIGAIATTGVILGSDVPMFIGAMAMGPFAGWVLKKFDEYIVDKIPTGFEMLVNNFSSGIIGFILAILGFYAVGPVITALTNGLAVGVDYIINVGVLPLANIFIEPAKVLFLNNALNHGILTPLATQQVSEVGQSVLFLLEANPGPGLGILLAYMFFGKGAAKASSPGAAIIHFLGGIHEIYFPYVMMKPLMFLAVIGGGVAGTFTFQLLGAGLSGPASPGSILAVLGTTAPGSHISVIMGVLAGTIVSFIIAALILRMDKSTEEDLAAEEAALQAEKSGSTDTQTASETASVSEQSDSAPSFDEIDNIVFACDAGMGSSAMGASLLRKKIKEQDTGINVTNSAINRLNDDANTLVITQKELTNRARKQSPASTHISVDNFLDDARYDEILQDMKRESSDAEPIAEEATAPAQEQTDTATQDYQNVEQVVFAYSGKVGASTMAASQLRNQFTKAGVTISVAAKDINDIEDNKNSLVFAEPALADELESKLSNASVEAMEDLLDEANYEEFVDQVK